MYKIIKIVPLKISKIITMLFLGNVSVAFAGVTGHVPLLCFFQLFVWGRGAYSFFVALDLQGEASDFNPNPTEGS